MDNKNFTAPADITAAMHKLITEFAGGYEAMAQQLSHDGTYNALSNRVRQVGGQMVPLGMAIQMESISGRTDITQAMCKRAGGVFVALPDIDQVDNEELLVKFNELLASLGIFARAHNEFTADGVLDRDETKRMRAKGYRVQCLVAEIMVVTEMLFGEGDASSVQPLASSARN
ncbi:DNA-binding protein [Pectobacterium polaris]|uniref:YmfL family putative regulatory protein n=1 Tax=Pectobacterium polaris TaxID=2042057 RepID=UPI000D607947|nr:YmfL family putative regulatory protein [Pectobacterium polaris]MCU1787491.1 DNA-binding protein [Pectobacterium polaris]PWD55476.1 DNA-binding protein [Pectobacterium polaris]